MARRVARRVVRRVVVAPDKFKGSVTAAQAAEALAAGLLAVQPDLDVVLLPVADGGDGTLAAAVSAGYELVPAVAEGPVGGLVETAFASSGDVAVVELADVTGLRLLAGPLAPLTASTYGVGQVIAAALDHGATRIVLGLGGSASTDGGAGLLQALGLRVTDVDGAEVGRGGAALLDAANVDVTGLDRRLDPGAGAVVLVASDVENPLLGPSGAAAVFGPQKGASPADVEVLERALSRWAKVTESALGRPAPAGTAPAAPTTAAPAPAPAQATPAAPDPAASGPAAPGRAGLGPAAPIPAEATPGTPDLAGPGGAGQGPAGPALGGAGGVAGADVGAPGAGAAGGTGFGAMAYLGARLVPGVELVLDLIGFDAALTGADLVITGEGSLDAQTLGGKAPVGVARAAARRGVPVVAVAGRLLLTEAELAAAGFAGAYSLAEFEPDPVVSMARAADLLTSVGRRIAETLIPAC